MLTTNTQNLNVPPLLIYLLYYGKFPLSWRGYLLAKGQSGAGVCAYHIKFACDFDRISFFLRISMHRFPFHPKQPRMIQQQKFCTNTTASCF